MTEEELGKVPAIRLTAGDWIKLIIVVTTAAVSLMLTLFKIQHDLQRDMISLDERWQNRVANLANNVHIDIRNNAEKIDKVRDSIPPDWFLQRVDRLENDIVDIKKDFVRKTELDQILRNGKK